MQPSLFQSWGEFPHASHSELASMAHLATASDGNESCNAGHSRELGDLPELPSQHGQRGGHITCWEEKGSREEEFLLAVIGGTEGSINWNVAAFFFGNTKGATQKRFERFLQARGLMVSDFWVMRDEANRAVDLLKNVYGVPEPGTIASRELLHEASKAPPPQSVPRDVGGIVFGRGQYHNPRKTTGSQSSMPTSAPTRSVAPAPRQRYARNLQQAQKPSGSRHMAQQRRQLQLMQQVQLQESTALVHQALFSPPSWPEIKLMSDEELTAALEEPLTTHTSAVLDAIHSTMLPAVPPTPPVPVTFHPGLQCPYANQGRLSLGPVMNLDPFAMQTTMLGGKRTLEIFRDGDGAGPLVKKYRTSGLAQDPGFILLPSNSALVSDQQDVRAITELPCDASEEALLALDTLGSPSASLDAIAVEPIRQQLEKDSTAPASQITAPGMNKQKGLASNDQTIYQDTNTNPEEDAEVVLLVKALLENEKLDVDDNWMEYLVDF
ncbi:uncharacterized protein BROUX77_002293 [Berkeleyomyces rouxiae]|uniref:uncharacterized protein n=1 Tax=Berkeleyomyces rouxiae TaxID=2035830 RepID=UPI003B77BC07